MPSPWSPSKEHKRPDVKSKLQQNPLPSHGGSTAPDPTFLTGEEHARWKGTTVGGKIVAR